MSHHDPMELGLFKTKTFESEDNQLFRTMLWMASIPRMFSDRNSAYPPFSLLHIKQVENQTESPLALYCPPLDPQRFSLVAGVNQSSESGWGTACDTSYGGSWSSRPFSLQTVQQKSPSGQCSFPERNETPRASVEPGCGSLW